MNHELKCWPEYFSAVEAGDKNFELRKDDRGFKSGDELCLREWDPETSAYTGKTFYATITYVLRGIETLGLQNGYCILSLAPW